MSGTLIGGRTEWRQVTVLTPISEGIPQDVLASFGVQESQGIEQPLYLAPAWEQLIPLFSGEMREFLPAHLGNLDWVQEEELVWMPGGEFGLWIYDPPEDWPV